MLIWMWSKAEIHERKPMTEKLGNTFVLYGGEGMGKSTLWNKKFKIVNRILLPSQHNGHWVICGNVTFPPGKPQPRCFPSKWPSSEGNRLGKQRSSEISMTVRQLEKLGFSWVEFWALKFSTRNWKRTMWSLRWLPSLKISTPIFI